jgi:hypothetical protein
MILAEHDITPAFLDIASCFYNKSLNVEEALSVPFQCLRSHDRVGIVDHAIIKLVY